MIAAFTSGGMKPRNILTKANLFQSVVKVGSVNSPPKLILKYIKEIRTHKYGSKQSFVACAVVHCKSLKLGIQKRFPLQTVSFHSTHNFFLDMVAPS